MEKVENFIKDYDSTQYHTLPKFIKRRVDALKKIQLEHTKLQHDYHKELQELELKYEKLYQPLYEKRFKIINGDHQPTDDECQLPANILDDEYDGDQENSGGKIERILNDEQEAELESKIKGVPGFWLGCLLSTYNFSDSVEPHDKPILRYLKDIRLSYGQSDPHWTYTLEFVFDENPYFTNKVLTKTYYLKSKPDDKDPFSYEGFEVCKSEGCEIKWNPGKDVTVKSVTVMQKNKNDGRTREKKKEVECDSFFYFFTPPKVPEGLEAEDIEDELAAVIAVDFELGEVLRNSIIPKAVLYFIGFLAESDDEEEDEDEDDDDESDSEMSGYEDSESDESNDSLNNKDKKKPAAKKSPKNAG